MNRQIKFRVWKKPFWSGIKNEMIYCSNNPFESNSHGYFCTGKQFFSYDEDYYAGLSISEEPDCEIMEFTGLSDQDNKEIYESDLISWDIPQNSASSGSEVKFILGCFGVMIGDSFKPLNQLNRRCMIVGNIYETAKY